jgi:SOS-response transcriptional repressor LexA
VKAPLTSRQREALDFIKSCIASRGYPPTLREIGEHMGIRSTNGVHDHLKALERKGYIVREELKSRSVTIVDSPLTANGGGPGWSFGGLLGSMFHFAIATRILGERYVRHATLELRTHVGASYRRTWIVDDTSPVAVAREIHAVAVEMLSHEVLDAMRLDGRQVFDAHPADVGFGVSTPVEAAWVGPGAASIT